MRAVDADVDHAAAIDGGPDGRSDRRDGLPCGRAGGRTVTARRRHPRSVPAAWVVPARPCLRPGSERGDRGFGPSGIRAVGHPGRRASGPSGIRAVGHLASGPASTSQWTPAIRWRLGRTVAAPLLPMRPGELVLPPCLHTGLGPVPGFQVMPDAGGLPRKAHASGRTSTP
jgi:hypothetical protein